MVVDAAAAGTVGGGLLLHHQRRQRYLYRNKITISIGTAATVGLLLASSTAAVGVRRSCAFIVPPISSSHCHVKKTKVSTNRIQIPPSTTTFTTLSLFQKQETTKKKRKIPANIRQEIYKAEAQTPAASNRNIRIFTYCCLTFITSLFGIGGVFLGFLAITTASSSSPPDSGGGIISSNTGGEIDIMSNFDWALYIPFLTRKWGIYLDFVLAGLFGTLAEMEFRTRDDTAEQIWEEMQKRRNRRTSTSDVVSASSLLSNNGGDSKRQRRKRSKKGTTTQSDGRKQGRNQRLDAFAEVVDNTSEREKNTASLRDFEEVQDNYDYDDDDDEEQQQEQAVINSNKISSDLEGGGILGTFKRFYKQADEIAAAQALLLNKKLEDEGILEKITDESGLKVLESSNEKGSSTASLPKEIEEKMEDGEVKMHDDESKN